MSIKSLFNKTTTIESAASSSVLVESSDFVNTKIEVNETFQPYIDFSDPANFAKFGLAEEYYKLSIERIHDYYPYDGSDREKLLFELSSSYLDKYILDNRYPKTNGYINLSYGGWGTLDGSKTDGYGKSQDNEFILVRGSIHVDTEKQNLPLKQTFDDSVVYDEDKNRVSSLKMDLAQGITTEFWLKKDAFDNTKTEKEVILDLWNGEASSSSDYGRFTLALSGTANGEDTFIVTLQSGTDGFYEQSIGTATVTTSSLSDWHHYALSFVSASSAITGRLYVDGELNESKSLGSAGINEIGGLINGYIGALQTSPSGSSAVQYAGKLSASLDDFRYWKTRRTSEEIYNNWYKHVPGGTNTEDNNVYLGVYYKFNEGILGTSADSTVLDYSGRLANGTWTGYSSGARSTSSAFIESGLVSSEAKDPIIYSSHSDVVSLKLELQTSGSLHDRANAGVLYNKVPAWVKIEDEETGYATKKLYQIIASYFDTLHAQITALPFLKNKTYPSSSYTPLPFADRLLEDKGLIVSELFADSNVLEMFDDRDLNQIQFEKKITDIKNQIYTNIYNNLEDIYKHKGTEGAIRNMLRCFGIDDEIVKLNIYTDQGKHYFSDAFKHTSINKKYIDFNKKENVNATIFQTSSVNHSLTYVSGSGTEKLEQYNALSSEISIMVPKKAEFNENNFFINTFQSASVFGMHTAVSDPADYTWESQDLANFQVYLVRDELESSNAKFLLKDYDNNFTLESPVFKEIYSNETWNLSVRVKPEDYPIAGNVVTSSNRDYVLEFYGVNHAFDTVKNEFFLTQNLNYDTGSAFLSNAKRFYLGSHWLNFTTRVLEPTDLKIGRFNFWYDYVGNDEVKLHNKDITSKGNKRTTRPSTMFGNNLTSYEVPTYELLAADWDFELVGNSDASGQFVVVDASSGSTDTRYGWIDKIVRREHRAKGFGFPVSTTISSNESVYSSKKELPEIGYSADGVTIKGEQEEYFIEDEDVSDNFFALEKSMYQTISEEMMRTLSTAQEMSNLMGEAVERYRLEYKKLNHVRRMFFEDVEEDPDFDRFTEYFKWIDSSMSYMVSQMFPMSVRFSKGISDVVESHLFERNKYQNKFPLLTTHTATEGSAQGVGLSKYGWKFGHAPLPTSTTNATFSSIAFTANHNGGAHQDFLAVTASGQTHLSLYADPNQAINTGSFPLDSIDHLIYTGSTGLAFRATGSTNGVFVGDGNLSSLIDPTDISLSFKVSGSGGGDNQFQFRGNTSSNYVYVVKVLEDFQIVISASTGQHTITYDTNQVTSEGWNDYAVVFSDMIKPVVYKNGQPVSGSSYTSPGGTPVDIDRFYVYLDEQTGYQDVIVWKKQLTQADVTSLYNGGVWVNPTSISSSHINDWYKFGYEDYWTGSAGDKLSGIITVSSSYGSGNNDLTANATDSIDIEFTLGDNPFSGSKSQTEIYDELTASLNSKFSSIYGNTTFVTSPSDIFTIQSASMGNNTTISATRGGTGFFSTNPSVANGVDFAQTFEQNTQCPWRKTREERADISERETIRQIIGNRNNKTGTIVSGSSGTYRTSNYGIRNFSKPVDMKANISKTLHPGINYNLQKNRDYIWAATHRGSELTSLGIPKNVLVVGAGPGQGIELPVNTCNDVETPNEKKKFNTTVFVGKFAAGGAGGSFTEINDSASYTYAIKGAHNLPFDIFSGSIGAYNTAFSNGYRSDAYVTNLHSDTTDFSNDVPLQGPFTNQWVGGHQSRHIELNKFDTSLRDDDTGTAPLNNLDNRHTRPEGWLLKVVESVGTGSDGAFGIVDAQYGVTKATNIYPDAAKKAATLYRDGRAKRAVNIANIQTTTSSANHGNYKEKYEIISSTGKKTNNLYFRKNSETRDFLPNETKNSLPQTTNYQTMIGSSPQSAGNVFGVQNNNRQNNLHVDTSYTGSNSNAIITSRFSAPGGIEVQSYGYLDAHSQEFSVYNNLNYRNYPMLNNSGERNTIRVNDHLGERRGLNTRRKEHSAKMYTNSTSPAARNAGHVNTLTAAEWNSIIGTTGARALTLSAFIKTSDIAQTQYIFAFGDSMKFQIKQTEGLLNNLLFFQYEYDTQEGQWGVDEAITLSGTSQDEFLHVAVSYVISSGTGEDPKFYINGKLQTTDEIQAPLGALLTISSYTSGDTTVESHIGANGTNAGNSNEPFVGEFLQAGIWSRILSDDEIKDLYLNSIDVGGFIRNNTLEHLSAGIKTDLELWHYFDPTKDTVDKVIDYSGNGRHSTTNPSLSFGDLKPSFQKQQRNENRRPSDTSTIAAPVLITRHDNAYVNSAIPRSDFQYKWINNSLGSNYSITSGKQRMYGYAHPTGILSSSVTIDGDSGFVPAITFPTASEIFGE